MNTTDRVFLGFDFGLSSIGVAVGQEITKTARGLTALKAQQGAPNWQQIQELIDRYRPDGLVVGIPRRMDGGELTVTKAAEQFAEELKQRFDKLIFLVDERLTTKMARAEIFSRKGFRGLEKAAVDAESARIILEVFLQTNP